MKRLQDLSREEALKAALVILGVAILAGLAFYLIFFEEVLSPSPELPEKKIYEEKRGESLEGSTTTSRELNEGEDEKFNEATTPQGSPAPTDPAASPDEELIRKFNEATSSPGAE